MSQQSQQVFSERYEILRHIARGGMAEVYLARDLMLDRKVALKVLFPELSTDRSFVERFRREAKAAANLSHPNIVPIYDWGEADDTYFIVMEYVDGRPLSSLIRAEGPLLADRAAVIGAAVANALAFAHRNGVIHRDVKPGNVLLDTNGHVKVTDFGIARAGNTDENLTQTGAVMGTATYFSPEQAQGQSVDARSDVYSLGVMLYEMVTGRPPFSGDSAVSIAYKHVREQPPTPREVNSAIPPAFEKIILQAMAKDPSDRYPGAEELRADLLRYRQGRNVMAVPPAVVAPAQAAGETRAVPVASDGGTRLAPAAVVEEVGPAPEPPPQRKTSAYVILLFVMLAALILLLFLLGRTLGVFGRDSAERIAVPSVIGQTADQADRMLTDLGFQVERRLENHEAQANVVFAQDPPPDTRLDKGDRVIIRISQGPATVPVPNVVGQAEDDARAELTRAGFMVATETQPDDRSPAGRVIRQEPRASTPAAKGSTVTLTVSTGREKVQVPSVVGKDAQAAAAELTRAGLRVNSTQELSTSMEAGRVIRTDPSGGIEVNKGTVVTMVVSSGPPPTTTQPPTTTSTTTTTRPSSGGGF